MTHTKKNAEGLLQIKRGQRDIITKCNHKPEFDSGQ